MDADKTQDVKNYGGLHKLPSTWRFLLQGFRLLINFYCFLSNIRREKAVWRIVYPQVKTDYLTGLAEVRYQKELVYRQHMREQEALQDNDTLRVPEETEPTEREVLRKGLQTCRAEYWAKRPRLALKLFTAITDKFRACRVQFQVSSGSIKVCHFHVS